MTMARSCGPGRCTVSTGTPSSVTNVAVVTTAFTALHSGRGPPVRAWAGEDDRRRRLHIANDLRPPDMPRAAHLGHLDGTPARGPIALRPQRSASHLLFGGLLRDVRLLRRGRRLGLRGDGQAGEGLLDRVRLLAVDRDVADLQHLVWQTELHPEDVLEEEDGGG